MADESAERFHEELERLLRSDPATPVGPGSEPLLRLAADLRDRLAAGAAPDFDFRSRLKAELLERYTNNVRQFPGPSLLDAAQPRSLWQRMGRAAIATAAASAACLGLVAGYSQLHAHQGTTSPVVALGVQHTPTPLPTATLPGSALPSPMVPPTRVTIVLSAPSATRTVAGRSVSTATPVPATPVRPAPSATELHASPSLTVPSPSATAAPASPTVPPSSATAAPSAPAATATAKSLVAMRVPSDTPARPTATLAPAPTMAPAAAATMTPVAVSTSRPVDSPTTAPSLPPTAPASLPTSTASPANTVPPAASDTATQRVVAPTATVLPTATTSRRAGVPAQHPQALTAVRKATALRTQASPATVPATATPTSGAGATATLPPGTDTPVVAATAQTAIVASVATGTPSGIAIAAASGGSTATAVPPEDQFPAPTLKDTLPDSPLVHTIAYTPAVRLNVTQVPDPGILAVCKPVTEPSPLNMLQAFNFSVVKLQGQTRTHTRAIVSAENVSYLADYQPRSSGYHLTLKRISPVPGALPQRAGFNAASAARIFLGAHQLTAIGSSALQADSVVAQPDGSTVVTFSELYQPGKIVGASAAVTFVQGVLSTLDIQWVDTSACPSAPGAPFLDALSSVLAGNGYIHTAGAVPDANARVTGTDIVYVPVSGIDGVYYEPVWRIAGVTGDAAASPFEVYVPAISDAYLR